MLGKFFGTCNKAKRRMTWQTRELVLHIKGLHFNIHTRQPIKQENKRWVYLTDVKIENKYNKLN